MNVSELARKLRVSTNNLFELLPKIGFDIGRRAIKVDDRIAQRIIREWPRLIRELDAARARVAALEEQTKIEGIRASQASVVLPSIITVRDLAERLNLPVTRVMRELMKNGVLANMNERIDHTTASIIAEDLGFQVEKESETGISGVSTEERLKSLLLEDTGSRLTPRPPVVVVMGHVDHGKTKLLDTIRQTHIMEGEAGGITQHIGAYQAEIRAHDGAQRKITFIDTPGHEAFMAMRARGAKIADIAILVVAADDGVKPQTEEAINIIRGAGLPIVVAINKIDKPEANLDKTKQGLSKLELIPEEWGGKTPMVPISAKQKTGIDELLNIVLLVADLEKEKRMASPTREAVGTIIESHIDRGEGSVATMLIHTGTLHKNDLLLIDQILYGKVRAMRDHRQVGIESAGPSTPVKILGFKRAPAVGDVVEATTDERRIGERVQTRGAVKATATPILAAKEQRPKEKTFPVMIKTDVLGSLEAIVGLLEQIEHPEVGLVIIQKGLGNITDADVLAAEANGARIYAFNVVTTPTAMVLAQDKGVSIERYEVIYHLEASVRKALEQMLAPETKQTVIGCAKILAIFRQERRETIAGGSVTDGKMMTGTLVSVLRGSEKIGTGKLLQLQSGKRDVKEIRMGQEFGMKIETRAALSVGDILEAYTEEQMERKLG